MEQGTSSPVHQSSSLARAIWSPRAHMIAACQCAYVFLQGWVMTSLMQTGPGLPTQHLEVQPVSRIRALHQPAYLVQSRRNTRHSLVQGVPDQAIPVQNHLRWCISISLVATAGLNRQMQALYSVPDSQHRPAEEVMPHGPAQELYQVCRLIVSSHNRCPGQRIPLSPPDKLCTRLSRHNGNACRTPSTSQRGRPWQPSMPTYSVLVRQQLVNGSPAVPQSSRQSMAAAHLATRACTSVAACHSPALLSHAVSQPSL